MARSASLFNGTTAGKVGEVVFFRAKGQQRARQYVGQINDRKSESQVKQRVMLSPCVMAYRLFKAVIKDSFVNSPMAQSGYNAFVSANKTPNRAYFSKQLVAEAQHSWANYKMSQGSLVPLPQPVFTTTTLSYTVPAGIGTGFEAFVTEFKTAYPDALAADRFTFARALNYLPQGIPSIKILSWGLDGSSFPAGVTYTAGKLVITLPADADTGAYSAVTIRSQRDANGKLNVSTQSLWGNEVAQQRYTELSEEEALQEAIASYGYNAAGVL